MKYLNMNSLKIEGCDETPPSMSGSSLKPPKALYIMFGPPCSGKTTWLKEGNITSVSLNDQPNVYIPVSTSTWMKLSVDDGDQDVKNHHTNNVSFDDTRVLHGKSIRDRILGNDNFELRWVLQRLERKVSQQELKDALVQNNSSTEMLPRLLACVEDILIEESECSESYSRPDTVDLFVREALWKSHDGTRLTGFQSAKNAMANIDPYLEAVGLDNNKHQGN